MLSALDDAISDDEDFDNLLDVEFNLTERKRSYQDKLVKQKSKNEEIELEAQVELEKK